MTSTEWWYARIYPGHPSTMDAAVAALAHWARNSVRAGDGDRWHFLRYLDRTGSHVRLRVAGNPKALDRLHTRAPELDDLTANLGAQPANPRPHRLLPEAGVIDVIGPPGVQFGAYEPETDKYGAHHLPDAEACFQDSSELMLDLDITAKPVGGARAGLAIELMVSLTQALFTPSQASEFWQWHRSYWGGSLRALRLSKEDLRERLDRIASAAEPLCDDDRIHMWAHNLADRLAHPDQQRRRHLCFHHLHMSMNRMGYLPAEEALLGLLATQST